MTKLPIDTSDRNWIAVRTWVSERVAEHTLVAMNVLSTDRQRMEAAVRADELRILLAAPADTLRASRNAAPEEQQRSTY